MWHQRGQNSWIFFELLFVGIFLWVVLDPLCVQLANKSIDCGYEQERVYRLKVSKYGTSTPQYSAEMDSAEMVVECYNEIIRGIRNLPEVECFAVTSGNSFANSGGFNGGSLYADSALTVGGRCQSYWVYPVEGSDILRTYHMRDANTGELMTIAPDFSAKYMIYISERMAKDIYGRTDVVGEKCYLWQGNANEIGGVFKDFKDRDYNQPYPMFIGKIASRITAGEDMQWRYSIQFRIKDGVDRKAFEKRFMSEVKPGLRHGNYYCSGIENMSDRAMDFAEISGELNSTRKNTIFAVFGLLCVFLGMVGTFWVRVNARRQEIGVMRSLGASRQRILMQFMAEAVILVTLTSVISIAVMANYVHAEGFFGVTSMMPEDMLSPEYWQNVPIKHFTVVSVTVWLVLLLTSILGTIIPVSRAARELPADALRDE